MDDSNRLNSCNTTSAKAASQHLTWVDLQSHARTLVPIDGGLVLSFAIDLADRIEALAAQKIVCCDFLSLASTRSLDQVYLKITFDNPTPISWAVSGIEVTAGGSRQ